MTPRISKAIDIFLDAISNGTLAKGNCSMCAVGNLCAGDSAWSDLFYTDDGVQVFNQGSCRSKKECLRAVQKSDFTIDELSKIEFIFETTAQIHWAEYHRYSADAIRKDQIKGLAAVVDVMLKFDDCKEKVREVFTDRAELIPV